MGAFTPLYAVESCAAGYGWVFEGLDRGSFAKVIHSPCGLKCLSVTKTVNNNKHNLNGMRINKKS